MSAALRKSDVVARFGGEEFVALLPGTDPDEAAYLGERLRAAVEAHQFVSGENNGVLRCTISVGVATFPHDGEDAAALMKQADLAVYQAKRTRNAVARPSAIVEPPPKTEVSARPSASDAPQPPLPWPAVALMWACIAGSVALMATSMWQLTSLDLWSAVIPFVLLSLAAEFAGVRIYDAGRDRISFSFGAAATMVAVTAMPVAAPLVATLGALVHIALNRRRGLRRVLFNLGNPALATGAAVWVYAHLRPESAEFTLTHVLAALAASVAFYLCNSFLISLLISLSARRSLTSVLLQSGWSTPTNILLGLTGAFLGGAHDQLGTIGTLMFAAPVLILRLTLDLYASRSQQAIDALRALNGQLETEIGQRKRFEQTLEHQALHDPLTDFPNRSFLLTRLEDLLVNGSRQPLPCALLLLDLDRFKEVNDTFGHQYGDLLLQQVGRRLRERLRAGDTIARLGGDEFGVLLPGAGAEGAIRAAHTILATLEQPLIVEGQQLEIDVSIGIAISPDHGLDPDILMQRADVAMYIAKRGHTGLAIYDAVQDQHSPARLQLVGDLRRAIEGDGLVLYYQPKASFETGDIVGAEALVRWSHPQHGLILPDEFIPLAENTGLIRPLSRWVLNDALRQCRDWEVTHGLVLSVAVNLSMRDIHDPQFPELASELLSRWGVLPGRLKLEITESAVMADAERAIDVLGRLRAMGVQLAIDDFGTGYSSLSYLKRLPVDELKIDRSFVRQMSSDQRDVAIVRSTIGLAHDLGLTVVAEGVEDLATWDMLARLSCDVVQGYYLARPLPAAAVAAWLQDRQGVELRAA
jgi:diguanylate cyclase (GGDEF)-like protein